MRKFKQFLNESVIKEDYKVVVIHTKNGKVDFIEKGEYMIGRGGGTIFVRDAGVNFDDFAGMDPKAAKDSLVKFSRYDPKRIIIEGCKKVQEDEEDLEDAIKQQIEISGGMGTDAENGDSAEKVSTIKENKTKENKMKTFKKFLEECETINEAEFNKEWWDSKSDSYKKRYIERHPNSIYAKKAGASSSAKPENNKSSTDTSKMSPKQKAKHFSGMLNPKAGSRYFAGQYVNPDNDDLPDDVLVDDEGKVIGFSDKAAFSKYGKKPTAQDKAANKELSNWLGSDDYNKVYNPDAKSTKSPKMSSAHAEKLSKSSKNPKELESIGTSLLDSKDKTNSRMHALGRLGKNPNTPEHILKRIEKEEPYEMLDSPRASKEFLSSQVEKLDPIKNPTWIDSLVQNPSLDKNHKKALNDKLNASLSKTKDDDLKDRIQWQLDLLNQ